MHQPLTRHTLDIFKKIQANLPPLTPPELAKEYEHALEHLENDFTIGHREVEDLVISLGKKIWPYWKAFFEFYDLNQGKLGEKFLLARLSPDLKKRYQAFCAHGGDYHDLRSGAPASFFKPEERIIITAALIAVDGDIRNFTRQAVTSTEMNKYEEAIFSFQEIIDDIEKRLQSLRQLAEDEGEHPRLAEEIRERVRAFEFGLCMLGPHTPYHEVINAPDYFTDRRHSKNLHRFE
ncbi:MAG TPA: hypothetical protein VJB37_00425 [Patescibacteria group bacterium]|nr:hypothetical protein [Patescibacteria group bacterium]